jgi:hypothetical protein
MMEKESKQDIPQTQKESSSKPLAYLYVGNRKRYELKVKVGDKELLR